MTSSKGAANRKEYIVIGAGPVGLLAAILLVKEANEDVDVKVGTVMIPTYIYTHTHTYTHTCLQVTIYEARDSLTTRLDESYPIGLNPRGVRAMDRANKDLAIGIRMKGFMVDGWRIFAGR